MRQQHRLMLLLDGMDEAGACRELLEAYVSCRLVTEVHLCVTARPQGIANMHLFDPFFVDVRVEHRHRPFGRRRTAYSYIYIAFGTRHTLLYIRGGPTKHKLLRFDIQK